MDWTNKCILEFLEYYKNEPIIWDPSYAPEKNRDQVFDAWKRIEKKFEGKFTILDLKRKKASLMATFRTCISRVKRSIANGSNDEVYEPSWFAYSKMASFLRIRDHPRDNTNSEDIDYNEDNEDENISIKVQSEIDQEPNIISEDYQESEGTESQPGDSGLNGYSVKKLGRKRKGYSDTTGLKNNIGKGNSVQQQNFQGITREKDICDVYGELIAIRLRKLDEQSRDTAMNHIDNMLYDMTWNSNISNNTYPMAPSPTETKHFN